MVEASLSSLVVNAYEYGFPLLMMDLTRRQATNVVAAESGSMRAPMNQFAHYRAFPAGDDRSVVRLNFDTLYSMAWLDLRDGPVVVRVPESPDRYYLTPMLDMWTDVFVVPGTRTTGGLAGDYAIAVQGWCGHVPDDIRLVHSPTPFVWILGRTQTNGVEDYARVHAVQDQYAITPLAQWGREYSPAPAEVDPTIDDVTDPQEQVWSISGLDFFTHLSELMAVNPAHPNDYPILYRLEKLGIVAGQPFSPSPEVLAVLEDGVAAARADIISSITDGLLGLQYNGWQWMQNGSGAYGTSYRLRAMVAFAGIGCNLPEDAVYPNYAKGPDGTDISGEHSYRLRFEAGHLPPADAFWSLTMYDKAGFQVPNTIDRYAIGDRDQLIYGSDGSLDLYIQHTSPGADHESNWLPAPAGPFELTMRIYSPSATVFREGLKLPALHQR